MTNIPRKHHLVPKFLLKRFAKGDKVVLRRRDDPSKVVPTTVQKALRQKNFYAIETADGWSMEIEEFLSKVETNAAEALERITRPGGFPPSEADREHLVLFMALQFQRGEDSRDAMQEAADHYFKMITAISTPEMIREYLNEAEDDISSDEEIEDLQRTLRRWNDYRIVPHQNDHILAMLKGVADFEPYLDRRTWRLVKFREPALLTGDAPIALDGEPISPNHGLGIESAEAVYFPIDSMQAIIMTRPGGVEDVRVGKPELARRINLCLAHDCYRWIVHRPSHEPMAGITLQPRRPFVYSGIGAGKKFIEFGDKRSRGEFAKDGKG